MQCKHRWLRNSCLSRLLNQLNQSNQSSQSINRSLQTSGQHLQFIQNQQFDHEYLLKADNWAEIERNIRLRKKNSLWKEWIAAEKQMTDDQLIDWIRNHIDRIPNRLHRKWTELSDAEASKDKDEYLVKTFGSKVELSDPVRKAEVLFRLKGWLQLPQHEQIGFVGGNRSYVMLDELCQLRDAVVEFAIDQLTQKYGFVEVTVPNLLYEQTVSACGFATKSQRSQVYTIDGMTHGDWQQVLIQQAQNKQNVQNVNHNEADDDSDVSKASHCNDGSDVCLAGTSEISLAALHFGEQLDHEQLPKKYCAVSRCYRAEVSPKAEESGIYRVHYFDKVEMFAFCDPSESDAMLEQFVAIQQNMFEQLGLHGRVLDMPPHELGNSATRKYDIEVYLAGRGTYGELSSASNCTDYQSRRLNVFSRRLAPNFESNEPFEIKHVHTVNGTAVAVPRMLIALAETYQTADGNIKVPLVLQPYMNNQTELSRRNDCFVGKKKHQEQLKILKQ